ncbi:Mu transposase C-terminal domain-containing protein [Nocardia sp. KC 131]|uniref:Mu transposase C-terminal domain-containing protein n=1 Tax=Nocardia arseniciresistens TaxID=3392119 RepID=UPI00398E93F8
MRSNPAIVRFQHYGVEFGGRRYNGEVLDGLRGKLSPYVGKAKRRWPIHYDPEDITRAWFCHPDTGWGPLRWEHAPAADMPFSEDALEFAPSWPRRNTPTPTIGSLSQTCSNAGTSVWVRRWSSIALLCGCCPSVPHSPGTPIVLNDSDSGRCLHRITRTATAA